MKNIILLFILFNSTYVMSLPKKDIIKNSDNITMIRTALWELQIHQPRALINKEIDNLKELFAQRIAADQQLFNEFKNIKTKNNLIEFIKKLPKKNQLDIIKQAQKLFEQADMSARYSEGLQAVLIDLGFVSLDDSSNVLYQNPPWFEKTNK